MTGRGTRESPLTGSVRGAVFVIGLFGAVALLAWGVAVVVSVLFP